MFLKKKKKNLHFNKIKNKNLYLSPKKKGTLYMYENNMFQKKKLLITNKILV